MSKVEVVDTRGRPHVKWMDSVKVCERRWRGLEHARKEGNK